MSKKIAITILFALFLACVIPEFLRLTLNTLSLFVLGWLKLVCLIIILIFFLSLIVRKRGGQ